MEFNCPYGYSPDKNKKKCLILKGKKAPKDQFFLEFKVNAKPVVAMKETVHRDCS